MPKFLAIHPVGTQEVPAFVESGTPFAKALKANLTPDAYWIRSWYAQEEGKLYCEWDAKDVASIRQVIDAAAKASFEFPIEGIYEIPATLNSEDFR